MQPHEALEAARVVCEVVCEFFNPPVTPEKVSQTLKSYIRSGELDDILSFQSHYLAEQGLFLVLVDDDRVVGTGAIRRLDSKTAEVKRMWLLPRYRGLGFGREILGQLLTFASETDYDLVRLDTSLKQVRAISFYKRAGFTEIPAYNDGGNDLFMELDLSTYCAQ